jgi:hypothetical protein
LFKVTQLISSRVGTATEICVTSPGIGCGGFLEDLAPYLGWACHPQLVLSQTWSYLPLPSVGPLVALFLSLPLTAVRSGLALAPAGALASSSQTLSSYTVTNQFPQSQLHRI